MGTTRIKVIDLSSSEKEIKTSRKHAEKLARANKLKKTAKADKFDKKPITESTEKTESTVVQHSAPSDTAITPSAITKPVEPSPAQDESTPLAPKPSITPTPRRARLYHTGKKYRMAKKLIEDKTYGIKDAFQLLPKTSITSFDPSVEIHLNVADKNIKGSISFPHALDDRKKKETKYLVFSDLPSEAAAKAGKLASPAGGSIIWGDEKTIADIEQGTLKPKKDFDIVIASPKFMPQIAKVAKILGPAHLMPNPTNGTVTNDIAKALQGENTSSYKFKSDPNAPVVHAKIGKLSQGDDKLAENLKVLIYAIGPAKIRKATLTTTMGPGIKLDLSQIAG